MHARGDRIGDLDMETDFYGDLLLAAQKLSRGEFAVEDYPYKGPLYAVVLAAVHVIVPDWFRAAVVVSALAAAGSLVLVYRTLARLFDTKVAAATMVMLSLVVELFVHAHHATTDLLFLCLASASVLALQRLWDAPPGRAAAPVTAAAPAYRAPAAAWAGALGAAAFLTRYNGAFLPLAAVAAITLVNPDRAARSVRWQRALVHCAAFCLVCVPWFALNLRATGRPLPSGNAQNIAAGLLSGPRLVKTPVEDGGDLVAAIAREPLRVAGRLARNWADHLHRDLRDLLQWPAAVVAVIGLIGVIVVPPSRRLWAYLCFPASYFVMMGPLFYSRRFFFFLVPAYAGLGIAFALGRRRRAGRRLAFLDHIGVRAVVVALGLAIVVVQVMRIATVEAQYRARRPHYLQAAAAALRAHAGGADATVMARKGHLAYVAGMRYQPYPVAASRTLEQLLEFAAAHGVDYIAYGVPEQVLCPDLRFLAVMDSVPGLATVYSTRSIRLFAPAADPLAAAAMAARQRDFLLVNLRDAERRRAVDIVVRVRGDLAAHYLRAGEVAAAEDQLRTSIAICDSAVAAGVHTAVMTRNGAVGRFQLSHILLRTDRAAEALPLAQHFERYAEEDGDRRAMARAALLTGRCYAALGRADAAAAALARARTLAPELASEPPAP
jgi:4-amino-4-deoxy-L-arabinose transferase-like glycosyltransferase